MGVTSAEQYNDPVRWVITTDMWRYANGVGEAILVCEKFRLKTGSTTGSCSPHKSIVIPLPIAGIIASAVVNTGN